MRALTVEFFGTLYNVDWESVPDCVPKSIPGKFHTKVHIIYAIWATFVHTFYLRHFRKIIKICLDSSEAYLDICLKADQGSNRTFPGPMVSPSPIKQSEIVNLQIHQGIVLHHIWLSSIKLKWTKMALMDSYQYPCVHGHWHCSNTEEWHDMGILGHCGIWGLLLTSQWALASEIAEVNSWGVELFT